MVSYDKKRYALTGYPLVHSLSAFIHSELFKLKGTDARYSLVEAEPDRLKDIYSQTLCRLDGFNVTIPHKVSVIPLLDALSEKAQLIGAVNTVGIVNGVATGYNTDCEGFVRSLEGAGLELGGRVLICGCGGVSRVFAFEAALKQSDITFAVRKSSLEKAASLCRELNEKLNARCKTVLSNETDGGYDLIINGTPAGMFPYTDGCPLPEKTVSSSAAVFDAVYNPAETQLLRIAERAGLRRCGGLPMLVIQAACAQEIWTGARFTEEETESVTALAEKELSKR